MDLVSGKGRKWVKAGNIYNYLTRWSDITLGRVIYDSNTNSYKVEKVDSFGEYVGISEGHKDILSAGKSLVKAIG